MRIITLHVDYIEFEPTKKAIKEPEKIEKKKHKVDECLVVLSAVEKSDEKNPGSVAEQYVKHVKDIAAQVKVKHVVLYPYVHLTAEPSSPKTALQILKKAEGELKKDFKVERSPFGWYKAFELRCKGHPLAELSREFGPESAKEEVSEAVKKEEQELKSFWYILDEKGKLHPIALENGKVKGFDFSNHKELEKFASYEIAKSRAVKEEPAHVKYMRKLELADYEPGSDPGNLRYYPKGKLIKGLIEDFVSSRVRAYGAMEIEAPIMYDYEHPSLKSYLNRFPARQYTIQTPNKKVFLRFAACFGQFLMAHDATISYKNLPFRIYEMTKYSFRVEQRGELTGLRRLRAFTMPDCHALCSGISQAFDELNVRFDMSYGIMKDIGFDMPGDFELGIRVVESLWKDKQKEIMSIVKKWGKPVLVEMWNQHFFYYRMKYELNYVDANDKATALTTDQIDFENGERYDINFVNEEGKKQHPLILHCSPSGAVERVMYALLENAYKQEKKGKKPMLPLWLAPTQVRILPVSVKNHLEHCENLMRELEDNCIRVDVDDNDETIGKRIRNAEREWVPYIVVVGEEEVKSGALSVRKRCDGKQTNVSVESLIKEIKEQTKGMPFRPVALSKYLSKRPVFVG